ncbi:MAG: glutamine synthetase adenylyltransferase, partial [Planctomycetes bacterium]|nr:glutamine synthetase adenylyltransferase [Planctomycetota bacterium]
MLELLRKLIESSDTHREEILSRLAEIGFRDGQSAVMRLLKIASVGLPADRTVICLQKLIRLLSETADPDAGLTHFERFVLRASDRQELFVYLESHPRSLEVLVRLFACSRYLTDTIIRSPDSLRELTRHRYLAELKSREEFLEESLAFAEQTPDLDSRLNALRRYQRSELLRIGTCDAFGLIDLRAATVQLSLLAEGLVQACLKLVSTELGRQPNDLTVLAFGKLGGEELNYSSDIDLVFMTEQNPIDVLPIAQRLVKGLQDSTAEGFLYRVDVRLRPWGRSGELVSTIESYLDYLTSHAEMWEKQALLKARAIAGSKKLGVELLTRAEPLIFGANPNAVRDSVRKSKKQIESDLRRSGREWGAVKLGLGSIRDIEFVVQSLQLVYGNEHRHVRSSNTLDSLVRLTDVGFLQADEYRRLTEGYVFLRAIEHSLQLMNNRQEHSLPQDSRELTALARRLDFDDTTQFLSHFDSHRTSIRTIYEKYLGQDRGLVEPVVTTPIPEKHI